MRGLEPKQEVDRSFMSREEMTVFFAEEFQKDQESISKQKELLSLLNLVPDDLELQKTYVNLYSEQVAGFYHTETDKLYVVGSSSEFGPEEKITYAHEYVHALQQQHFDIRALGETAEGNAEASAALRALIEGDATVVELQYMFLSLPTVDLQELLQSDDSTSVFEQAPYVLRMQLLYPYIAGLSFVSALLQSGQRDAINEAYKDPPVSTEQILHPQKYFDKEVPIEVSMPDLPTALGEGWTNLDSDILGEFFLRTYLETGLDNDEEATEAGAGWGGDAYVIMKGPNDEQILVLLIVWDTKEDAQEFYEVALEPLEGSKNERFAGIDGDMTVLVVAPTAELIEAVLGEMPGFGKEQVG